MTNILHINSNYLTSKLHENLMDRLYTADMTHTVFMPIKESTQSEFLYESKYDVHHPVAFTDRDKWFYTYKQKKIYKALKETIDVKSFDMVHAHTLFTDGNVAYELYKEYGIPYVVTVRGYTDLDSFFRLRINLREHGRDILRHASRINFLSEANKKDLFAKYIHDTELRQQIEAKSSIIPNGIDDIYFEKEGLPKTLNKNEPIKFIQVSKVMPIKNHMGSLRGIQEFSKRTGQRAKFDFVGNIVSENYFKKISKADSGISTYHEPVGPDALIEYYRKSDIFIMPSHSETFGLVYPEAMSQGLPVLYPKDQGFDGQFEAGYIGYPVNPKDPSDIADKIILVVENYDQLSQNALTAYKHFNWDTLGQQYKGVYESVLYDR